MRLVSKYISNMETGQFGLNVKICLSKPLGGDWSIENARDRNCVRKKDLEQVTRFSTVAEAIEVGRECIRRKLTKGYVISREKGTEFNGQYLEKDLEFKIVEVSENKAILQTREGNKAFLCNSHSEAVTRARKIIRNALARGFKRDPWKYSTRRPINNADVAILQSNEGRNGENRSFFDTESDVDSEASGMTENLHSEVLPAKRDRNQ